MRKLSIISYVLIAFVLNANAQNVKIPDPNFKKILVENLKINTNGDKEIQFSEAKKFKGTINVHESWIKDLTGIEAFVNIHTLYAAFNEIPALNLSKNKKLRNVDCSGNEITKLVLGKQTRLEVLMCADNKLDKIDLSGCSKLKTLVCSTNPMKSLDVAALTNLEVLTCDETSLSDINLSLNPMITELDIRNCQFTELDLSSNPRLSTLYADNNKLSVINLANGGNGSIKNISLEGNPDLKCVKIDAHQMLPNWYKGRFKHNCD